MGCAPSIHVSQASGVVLSSSDHEASSVSANNHQVANTSSATVTVTHTIAMVSSSTSESNSAQSERGRRSKGASGSKHSKHAKTDALGAERAIANARDCHTDFYHFGSMHIKKTPMKVLLVFNDVNSQCEGFKQAAIQCQCSYLLARSPESALDSYLEHRPDLVIIDTRQRSFDAESLCRSLRATKANDYSVFMAVTKKLSPNRDEASISSLIVAGFTRRFSENVNVGVCLNELLLLKHGEVQLQKQLSAAMALYAAAEHCSEAIEVTNDCHEIEYINPAHERLSGYANEEAVGKNSQEFFKRECNATDSAESMNSQLRKGKVWEGVCHLRKKSGDTVSYKCRTAPVTDHLGKPSRYVSMKTPEQDSQNMDRIHSDLALLPTGGCQGRRRESFARIHSMTIEAPITKVINIINAAQENSPNSVVQALDKVLDILRSSELYSPHFKMKEDPVMNDLVGGLMTTNVRRYSTITDTAISKTSPPVTPTSSPTKQLMQMSPELEKVLETENSWDFDIEQLEKLSNRRPMMFLGIKTFQRFRVMDYLRVGERQMAAWLHTMESNYHSNNPYHNSTHAADVLHATAYFLSQERCKMILDPMDEVAALIAAVIHDLDHPGRTNSFLVNAGDPLAVLYNDLAVLESHHSSMAFHLTMDEKNNINIFSGFSREDFRVFRQHVIDMVLATEMTKHFEHLNKFASSINGVSAKDETAGLSSSQDSVSNIARLSLPENRMLIKRVLIKCADVSNPARPLHLCKMWADRIAEEYCDQTEDEKNRGLPVVMPVFDRQIINVPRSQISFIDFFINDMFDAWDEFCDIPVLSQHIRDNYSYWKQQEAVVDAKRTQTVPDSS